MMAGERSGRYGSKPLFLTRNMMAWGASMSAATMIPPERVVQIIIDVRGLLTPVSIDGGKIKKMAPIKRKIT